MENNEILDNVNFNETEEPTVYLELASNNKRFLNYLLDGIVIGTINHFVTPLLGIENISLDFGSLAYWRLVLISMVINFLYYWPCESLIKGQTLGKLITKTKVLHNDGSTPTPERIFIRSLIRLIPFEAFSIFSTNGLWHDDWSQTMVIDINKSDLPDKNGLV